MQRGHRSLRHLAFANQLVDMLHRLAKDGDLAAPGLDQGVELRHLDGVVPLLVLAEPEEVRVVLRPPAMEEEEVLGIDDFSKLLDLILLRASFQVDALTECTGLLRSTIWPSI